MPTYDYVCQACEHSFEEFQSITAKSLRKCPECGKLKLKRLIGTGAGVIFKGSGFYETDYRSDNYKKSAKAESDSAKPKSDKAESKTKDTPKKSDTPSPAGGTSEKKTKPSKP
jgi:putative FmdB family regulatory protein